MTGDHTLTANAIPWLLEPDSANPGVRYFALRDLRDLPADDPQVAEAQAAVMQSGPVPVILDAQEPGGYWVRSDRAYVPKYRGTVWQVMFLIQLGCDTQEPRLRRAAETIFDNIYTENGTFSHNGSPSGALHCIWGNMIDAMITLGYAGDERIERAIDALARSVTGDGYERYYDSGLRGPEFVCNYNGGLACAWGAIRALMALNRVTAAERTPIVDSAIEACVDFLLGYNVALADYPHVKYISSNWFKFGYPIGYITDVLLNLEALAGAGVIDDPRLDGAVRLVLSKQDDQGRWKMGYSYNGKMWIDIEQKGKPSKWVTLRALRVLKRSGIVPIEWLNSS
ncbi:MAG: nitrogen fixation protein NifH [Anaerolineae bacterium]|nr:nitrogen fixation protein NifH [Anaerolineae bacterium]